MGHHTQQQQELRQLQNDASRDKLRITLLTLAGYLLAVRFQLLEHTYELLHHQSNHNHLHALFLFVIFFITGLLTYTVRQNRRLKSSLQLIQHIARVDPLTGIRNRSAITDELEQQITRSRRYPQALSVLWMDVDNFKTINDTIGHISADNLLVDITQRIQDTLRTTDTFGRLGGDEFIVILPETGPSDGEQAGQRILSALNELSSHYHSCGISVSVSIGLATHIPGESMEALLTRVDAAMYEAKGAGKSRLIAAGPQASYG